MIKRRGGGGRESYKGVKYTTCTCMYMHVHTCMHTPATALFFSLTSIPLCQWQCSSYSFFLSGYKYLIVLAAATFAKLKLDVLKHCGWSIGDTDVLFLVIKNWITRRVGPGWCTCSDHMLTMWPRRTPQWSQTCTHGMLYPACEPLVMWTLVCSHSKYASWDQRTLSSVRCDSHIWADLCNNWHKRSNI